MFTIKLTAQAKRELKNISQRQKISLNQVFEDLKEDPFSGNSLTRELTGRFSYRVGLFRIIYKVNLQDKSVAIITAGHRGKVYKETVEK